MTIQQIMDDKSVKRLEKRKAIVEGIINGNFDFSAVSAACSLLPEKKSSLLLEAIEEVSRSKEFALEEEYLQLSEGYILSSDPSCKREASSADITRRYSWERKRLTTLPSAVSTCSST